MLSQKEVQHIAKLARISLLPREERKFQKELSSILAWIEKLKEVEIQKEELSFYSIPLKNVMREDEIKLKKEEEIKKLIELMPETKNNYLKIKSVFS